MGEQPRRFFGKKSLGIGLLLTTVWFLFFWWALTPFVPFEEPLLVAAIALFTASCISGVFFIATQAWALVFVDEQARRR